MSAVLTRSPVHRDATAVPVGNYSTEGVQALSESLMLCGRVPCGEHGEACAYHGDESGRCPWCHCAWGQLAHLYRHGWTDAEGRSHAYTWGEVHSCEQGKTWRGKSPAERARRVDEAARMRQEAVRGGSAVHVAAFCAHVGERAAGHLSPVSEPHRASETTRGIAYVECVPCDRRFGVMAETIGFAVCSGCRGRVNVLGAPEDYGKRWNDSAGLKAVRQAVASARH